MATSSTFFRIFHPLKLVVRRGNLMFFIVQFIYIGINVSLPYIMGRLIQALELQQPVTPWFVGFTIVGLLFIVINLLNRYMRSWYDRKVMLGLYEKYLPQFFYMNPTAIESYGTGKLFAIVIKGLDKWTFFFIQSLMGPVYWLLNLLLSSISLMIFVNVTLGVVALCITFINIMIAVWGSSLVKPYRQKLKKTFEEGNRLLALWMMSKQEILQNNKIAYEMSRNRKIFETVISQSRRINTQSIVPLEITRTIVSVFIIYAMWVVIQEYTLGLMTLGIISMTFQYLMRIRGDMVDMTKFFESYNDSLVDIERMREFFDTTPYMKHVHSNKKFQYNKGEISFDNVSFAYKDNKEVIENLSLLIKAKKKTALVGPSGGGKTTIMKLIGGFLEPTKGKILIDEQNINKLNPISYYKHIGYLTQEPSVFDGTIRENLIYGLSSYSDQEKDSTTHNHVEDIDHEKKLIEALERAQCQFVFEFSQGIDTEIGERGVRLSGGQRQRLAIAKIFLRNPEIILLDEPTSALDSMGEELVTKAMEELFKKRTVIIIAHRLQTVKHADEILYIENGQIVERGTHAALEKKGGKYARMLELQTGF